MSRLNGIPDGCPQACRQPSPVIPLHTEAAGPHMITCLYRCPACLGSWRTSWDIRGREAEVFGDAA